MRTRSAQDFGVALTGGGCTRSLDFAGPSASTSMSGVAVSTALARRQAFDGSAPLTASEVTLTEGRFEGREANGIFGTAGTIGSTGTFGRPEGLIFGVTC